MSNNSPLVSHIDGFRRVWMFPRNIRKIHPAKISEILCLLQAESERSSWSGNQDLQNKFCKALELAGIKRPGDQYDSHSGGPRTYLAQLECLGLTYKTRNANIRTTLAGEKIAEGEKPLRVMQWILARHQYPSIYSSNRNVRINPNLRVKPFLFVLRLMEKMDYMENREFSVPVIYGHNDRCLDICADKINDLRCGKEINDIIDSDADIYLPRSQGDREKDIKNIGDIGNTCKNYLEACNLIEEIDIDGRPLYIVSDDGLKILNDSNESYIDANLSIEQFQRKFGCYGRDKDTRQFIERPTTGNTNKYGHDIIRSRYIAACGTSIDSDLSVLFANEMYDNFGFTSNQVSDALAPLRGKELDIYESHFIEISKSGGAKAIEFEKAIIELLKSKFEISALSTGQRKRPAGKRGGYADALVLESDRFVGIIDAKASAKYSITSSDYRAMVNDYATNFTEHAEVGNRKLSFTGYIAGGFDNSIESQISNISREINQIPCSAITSRNMIDMASMPNCKDEFYRRVKSTALYV